MNAQHAYRVSLASPEPTEFIVQGPNVFEAVEYAAARIDVASIKTVELVGLMLNARGASGRADPARKPARPAKNTKGRPTRREQVVQILRRKGGEAHLDDLQEALGTNRANVQNSVASAVKAGLVERVGRRTGRVRLK